MGRSPASVVPNPTDQYQRTEPHPGLEDLRIWLFSPQELTGEHAERGSECSEAVEHTRSRRLDGGSFGSTSHIIL